MSVLSSLIEAIRIIIEMTWATWWALVFGFTLSGAVEVFVSEKQMTQLLGDDGWREVGLGMLFGSASSSCSYSAVGTSKALFKKGASGVASLGAFLFAATDLVIELGLVMWVLLGWQFVVGEYTGGVIATLVLALIFKHVIPQEWFEGAREHVHDLEETTCEACGMEADPTDKETARLETVGGTKYFCCGGCLRAYESRTDGETGADEIGWTDKLLTREGWDTAAKKTLKEWEMLWEDIALGFVLAGFIAAFVPQSWWATLFSAEGTLELVLLNTVLAAVIGIVTFMCSVGNVPFALVLWQNGLPFGGVLSFIYADLIIPPLVNMYRKYYGLRLAAVLFGSIFVAAIVSGVLVHYLMGGLGLIPDGQTGGTLSGEYTVILNLLFTPVFLVQVYVAYGPTVVVETVTSLPGRVQTAMDDAEAVARSIGEALWAFCLDTAAALLLVAEAILLVGKVLWLLAEALRKAGEASGDLLRELWEIARRL